MKQKLIHSIQSSSDEVKSKLPFFEQDIWNISWLGLQPREYKKEKTLSFNTIEQVWLKILVKQFVFYTSTTKKYGTISGYITHLKKFSIFLSEYYPTTKIENINRTVIIDFLVYLKSNKVSVSYQRHALSSLKDFFEIGITNQWFVVDSYLVRSEDFPRQTKNVPRYIPEEVMFQLRQHLDELPEPMMRMVLILEECGFRIGEILMLSIDCLRQDNTGGWWIQYMNWKMNKESTKPISKECAAVIQEQQQYIRDNLDDFEYLFCARKKGGRGKNFVPSLNIMGSKALITQIKKIAKKLNIKDNSGQLWDFQIHQFRHTVATKMINNGTPQHIVQRYLDHDTPAMTSVYAHIHDQTLKQEIAKYHDNRVVNVAGEVVESTTPELDNNLDLHLLKKKVLAQSLPNGSCARPIVLGECPHANACLTCGDFRTTIEFLGQHKAQLEETEKLVQNAEEKGWKRHAEMNTKVKDNLKKIITTLESGNQEIVSGGGE